MKRILTTVFRVTLLALSASCGAASTPLQNSPSDVVRAFYRAANDGRYSAAEQLLSEEARNAIRGPLGQMAGGSKAMFDTASRNGTITAVEIQNEEIRGEGAVVVAKIWYKDGPADGDEERESLIKVNGSWKLTLREHK